MFRCSFAKAASLYVGIDNRLKTEMKTVAMSEPFVIPVLFQNKMIDFPAQLFTSAYNYQIRVLIEETEMNFERDDEGNFRAIASSPDDKKGQNINIQLLQAIAHKLNDILS